MGESRMAPRWVRVASWAVSRLPAGRYHAMNWIARRASVEPFWLPLPRGLGGMLRAAMRRAAYARSLDSRPGLKGLDEGELIDPWPHTLWIAPGEERPFG